jgi:hypothetical protein
MRSMLVLMLRYPKFVTAAVCFWFFHQIHAARQFCFVNRVGKLNKKKAAKDSDMPKRPPSAYLIFM